MMVSISRPMMRSLSVTKAQIPPIVVTRTLHYHRLKEFSVSCLQRKAKEGVSSNPFYDKYKDKIEKAGGISVEKLENTRQRGSSSAASRPQVSFTTPPLLTKHFSPPNTGPVSTRKLIPVIPFHIWIPEVSIGAGSGTSLNKIMIVDKIWNKSTEEIGVLWKEYHRNKDSVSAVIPADIYIQLSVKATLYPLFLYPLPRDEGYEFFYSQFNGHSFYFTSLLNYQLHQENAPTVLTLLHYTELQQEKGIVLMSGEFNTTTMTAIDAQFLANQVQLYYASDDAHKYNLLKQFNLQPNDFDYHVLIDELQSTVESKLKH